MKKIIVLFILSVFVSCSTNKKYSDFDYSFARNGGYAPAYENLWIKGNHAHYTFEGEGKNIKKDFSVSNDDIKNIEEALAKNNFRTIREDLKKVYDYRSTSINVKKGPNSGSKSDASFIMENDKPRWENIIKVFQQIIDSNVNPDTAK